MKKGTLKKAVCGIICCALATLSLAGCKAEEQKPQIVASTYVIADWIGCVLGEDVQSYSIYVLCDNGEDIHSYEPTVRDIYALSRCSLFVHAGGGSEEWVEGTLGSAKNPDMTDLSLMHELRDLLCETDGQEHEEKDSHDGHEHEHDEHIWFSEELVCASIDKISEALGAQFPERAETYTENAAAYRERVEGVFADYRECVRAGARNNILVADRFPFFYLTSGLGLEYAAAFDGCSAETEASFEVISRLSGVIDDTSLGYVIICEGTSDAIANAVISNTRGGNAVILTLDSMQSVTEKDVSDGWSYIGAMEGNLAVLATALSK